MAAELSPEEMSFLGPFLQKAGVEWSGQEQQASARGGAMKPLRESETLGGETACDGQGKQADISQRIPLISLV